jgi:hypothetical protein
VRIHSDPDHNDGLITHIRLETLIERSMLNNWLELYLLLKKRCNKSGDVTSVVEPEPVPKEPYFFALTEQEQECSMVPEPYLYPDPISKVIKNKIKTHKNGRPTFWDIN